eukprot:TsM_000047700 transcript=TsM_000047700 gene=TsM_000047700
MPSIKKSVTAIPKVIRAIVVTANQRLAGIAVEVIFLLFRGRVLTFVLPPLGEYQRMLRSQSLTFPMKYTLKC